MKSHNPDMFHDHAVHELEGRLAFLVGVALMIGILHWIIYRAAF